MHRRLCWWPRRMHTVRAPTAGNVGRAAVRQLQSDQSQQLENMESAWGSRNPPALLAGFFSARHPELDCNAARALAPVHLGFCHDRVAAPRPAGPQAAS